PRDLSSRARDLLLDEENERYLSIASSWEIAIKYAAGKLDLPANPEQFVPEHRDHLATDVLAIDEESVLHLPKLPFHHRDPFDRILICQAIIHGMAIVTPDDRMTKYPIRTIW